MSRSPCLRWVVRALVMALAAAAPRPAVAQNLYDSFWIPNGPVYAAEPYFDRMMFGGQFSRVGPPTGSGALTDRDDGALLTPYLHVDGTVRALVADGAGGWFVGGNFTTIRGVARHGLAHLDALGAVTAFAPLTEGEVYALHLYNGALYVGGDFFTIAGVTHHRLAALDPTTGADLGWATSANSTVRFIGQFSGLMYVGGDFTDIGGVARLRVAAIHPTTGALQAWSPDVNGRVNAVFRSGTQVAIGGLFTTVDGNARDNLVVVTTGGVIAPATHVNAEVHAITTSGSAIHCAGDFTTFLGASRQRLAAFDLGTSAVLPWNPGADARVRAMVYVAGQLWIGGDFGTAGGSARGGAANLSPSDNSAGNWIPNPAGPVHAIALDATRALIGGNFFSAGPWVARENLAALTTDPNSANFGKVHAWNPGVNGVVRSITVTYDGNYFLIGGNFTLVMGQPRINFATLVWYGGLDPWAPEVDDPVLAICQKFGAVWLGGTFATFAGTSSVGLTAVDIAGGIRPGFESPPVTGPVLDIDEVHPTHSFVFVGGSFQTLRGSPRNGLGQVDRNTGLANGWNPIPPDSAAPGASVVSIMAGDQIAYVAGNIPSFGVSGRRHLLAFDIMNGAAESMAPNPDGPITAMNRSPFHVFIGGEFTNVWTLPRTRLAALDANTQAYGGQGMTHWAPTLDAAPSVIAVQGNVDYPGTHYHAHVGGAFQKVNGWFHPWFAVIDDQSLRVLAADPPPSVRPRPTLEPNPMRAAARMHFALARAGVVSLRLYDAHGRVVATPLDAVSLGIGSHEARIDARGIAPGLYWYRLDGPDLDETGKVVVLR